MRIRNILYVLAVLISIRSVAQHTGTLIIFHELDFEGSAYTITVYKDTSNIAVATRTYDCQEEIQLDSVDAGKYTLVIRETDSRRLYFSREVDVLANDVTRLYVNLDVSETKDFSDSVRFSVKTGDGEINFGYQNGKHQNPNSVFLHGFMLGMGAHYWKVKHSNFASMFGFGLNYRYNKISGDTSFLKAPETYKKKEEFYHYLDAHLDFKIRVCSRSQKIANEFPNFIAELGAIYNFPLYFRYRGNYEGNKTIQAWGIHQFTDFRAFVNVGFYPLLFFYEYRLSNFVIGNYPEVPRSTFGVRLIGVTLRH